jgi:hypothetical protein
MERRLKFIPLFAALLLLPLPAAGGAAATGRESAPMERKPLIDRETVVKVETATFAAG